MRLIRLATAGLRWYWRTHLAVVLGVATTVSVLGGALVVGDSVRASLRRLALARLGRAELAVTSPRFFREELAEDLRRSPSFGATFADAAPILVLEGSLAREEAGRRASGVTVYGVDERFFRLHGAPGAFAPEGRDVLLSEALHAELDAGNGGTLLLKLDVRGAVSGATLFGRRDVLARTARLNVRGALPARSHGDFSLRPQQRAARAAFVSLATLQRTLRRTGQVNTVLVSTRSEGTNAEADLKELVRHSARLEDLGLKRRAIPAGHGVGLESEAALLPDEPVAAAVSAARALGLPTRPILTYLADTVRVRERAIPYSVVSGVTAEHLAELAGRPPALEAGAAPIVLNAWAARELGARPGDEVRLEYRLWREEGRLEPAHARFVLAAVAPGVGGDAEFAPEYPGITDALHVADWDPPFPVDLKLIRRQDEAYWDAHRATPKAYLLLDRAQELWGHRLGRLTSLRLPAAAEMPAFETAMLAGLDPARAGLAVESPRARALAAAAGTTDFGRYFLYFSAFTVASALLLTGLLFRLGLEQRLLELGLLRAVGFAPADLRRLHLGEGLLLAVAGAVLGGAGAVLYGRAVLCALGTVWVGAVGTRELAAEVRPASLAAGAALGVAAAGLAILLVLRALGRLSSRRLLSGEAAPESGGRVGLASAGLAAGGSMVALALLALAAFGRLRPDGAFFGAGACALAAGLAVEWRRLRSGHPGTPSRDLRRVGSRGAVHRPGRSLLTMALVAAATFVIVAVGAFRHGAAASAGDPRGPDGGFAFVAESLLPVHHDPGRPDGRVALGLDGAGAAALDDAVVARFRLRPGDDVSCRNLYRSTSPRILGATPDFVRLARFSFQSSLARTPAERENPWLLLEGAGEEVPAVGDANTLAYSLHVRVGDTLSVERGSGRPLRLRIVAALRPGLLQSELVVAESRFLAAFPEAEGYRFFLVDGPEAAGAALESRLGDAGLDVAPGALRLRGFHEIENTYISTFQALGGLGLLLGTVGLATVVVRNTLERRKELALLTALGYRREHLVRLVLWEQARVLAVGLGLGAACALVAIAPALRQRGGTFPLLAVLGLLLAVAATGLLVSRLAVALVHRSPLLPALRSE